MADEIGMVERVMLAMADADGQNLKNPATTLVFRKLARAAISAMREPTEAMIDAAHSATQVVGNLANVVSIHQAVIDAALSEDKPHA